jgi:hypothetical protein
MKPSGINRTSLKRAGYIAVSSASYVYNSTTGDLMSIDHIYNSTSFESLAYTYDARGLVNSLDRAGLDPLAPGFLNASFDSANRHSWAEGISRPVYDRNGNMTAWGDMGLSWDQKGRLTGVTGARRPWPGLLRNTSMTGSIWWPSLTGTGL